MSRTYSETCLNSTLVLTYQEMGKKIPFLSEILIQYLQRPWNKLLKKEN